jgi:hypothetical protein
MRICGSFATVLEMLSIQASEFKMADGKSVLSLSLAFLRSGHLSDPNAGWKNT